MWEIRLSVFGDSVCARFRLLGWIVGIWLVNGDGSMGRVRLAPLHLPACPCALYRPFGFRLLASPFASKGDGGLPVRTGPGDHEGWPVRWDVVGCVV